jgi:uncharacterized metal-binding protein YceD (DUF177 family)
MKIATIQLNGPLNIDINGHEPWMEGICYLGENTGQITGKLCIERQGERQTARIFGSLEFSTVLTCDLCAAPIPSNQCVSIDAMYRHEPENLASTKLHVLSKDELDDYYFGEDESVDLFEVINDAVFLQIPDHPRCASGCKNPVTTPPSEYSGHPAFQALSSLK